MVRKIRIDPGHGGDNWGCVWPPPPNPHRVWNEATGSWEKLPHKIEFKEKDYVLELALELFKRKRLYPDLDISLTRYDDESLDYNIRGRYANVAKVDRVIALHVNYVPTMNLCGASVFHWPSSRTGGQMARAYMSEVPTGLLGNAKRVVSADGAPWKRHARYILGVYQAPTILVEVGFLSDQQDRKMLVTDDVKETILAGIIAAARA